MTEKKSILIVEDEFITSDDIRTSLLAMGFLVCGTASTGEQAIQLTLTRNPDLILMDINLKGNLNGIETATEIKKLRDVPVVYLTGQSDDATFNRAISSEPFGYIIKPFEERNLKTVITMALYKHRVDQQVRESEGRYRAIAESVDDSILLIRADETVEYANRYLHELFHIPDELPPGTLLTDILPPSVYSMIHAACENVTSVRVPLRLKDKVETPEGALWLDTSYIPLFHDSGEISEIFMLFRDITIQMIIEVDLENKGILQVEKNMEQFQILNDEIRNPLTIIAGIASLMDDEKTQSQILEQVHIIDDLITQLDKGWIESEKVRSFLLRHYHHGKG